MKLENHEYGRLLLWPLFYEESVRKAEWLEHDRKRVQLLLRAIAGDKTLEGIVFTGWMLRELERIERWKRRHERAQQRNTWNRRGLHRTLQQMRRLREELVLELLMPELPPCY